MQYRLDKKANKNLSVLGFGCMRFPRKGLAIDVKLSEELVIKAVELGINYFDTAYIYPGSESVLGEILEKNKLRDKVFIATKLPHSQCIKYEDFDKLFEIEKKRLRTVYIDYYLIHNIVKSDEWDRLCSIGIERWIDKKKESKEIKAIGFSFHGAVPCFYNLIDSYSWDFCMIQYNYMNEFYQAGRAGLERAHEKGMAVIIMEPLLGGKLATGLPPEAQKLFNRADETINPAEWSLMWLLDQREVTVVLSGMNSMEQLTENSNAAQKWSIGSLSRENRFVIEEVRKVVERSYKVACTGCNYCMPCPANVNIPACFASLNLRYAMGYITGIKSYVMSTNAIRTTNNGLASKCISCSDCEKKCPQHIKIIDELKATQKKLEPLYLRLLLKIVRMVRI